MMQLRRALPLLALLVAGCGSPATPAGPVPPGAVPSPSVAQVVAIGVNNVPPTMDSMVVTLTSPRRWDVHDMLVRQAVTGEPEATGLAEQWRAVDATTWEFKLAPAALFHDETPVTAEDVVFSLQRAIDPAKRLPITPRVNTIRDAQAVDRLTVRVLTNGPDPILIRRVASVPIYPKAYFERVGESEFGLRPIGAGPFQVKEFVANDLLVIVPFARHHRLVPRLSEVRIRQIPDAAPRLAGVRTKELDAVMQVPIDQATTLRSEGLQLLPYDVGSSGGCRMSGVDETPVKDRRVRLAINYAVDKEAIARVVFAGLTKPEQGQLVQPGVVGFNPRLQPFPFDQGRARQLLTEAGWTPGTVVGIEWLRTPQRDQMVLAIQSQLREVGIELDLKPQTDPAQTLGKLNGSLPREPIGCGTISTTPALDADFALSWFVGTSTARWLNNPDFDRAYLASRTEMDPRRREALLQEALQVMRDDPPYLFLVPNLDLAAHGKQVQNVVIVNPFELDLRQSVKTG
ncbi:MAG: ABC transporter substrate-binding protein [Dehalococcoidia bacterium]|nr:MAG: ABC transporter substrate-binding protein [Dehalococcoidia bacterium]